MSRENSFWTSGHDYEELARTFYENIEYEYPDYVTSDRVCCDVCKWCSWCATSVKYYKYTGPRI